MQLAEKRKRLRDSCQNNVSKDAKRIAGFVTLIKTLGFGGVSSLPHVTSNVDQNQGYASLKGPVFWPLNLIRMFIMH